MKIAIIGGAGKMGRWFARFLAGEGYEVVIADRDAAKLEAAGQELGVPASGGPEAVKEADVVLLAVGIESLEEAVWETGRHIQPGQMVFDITSIKRMPVDLMHRYLNGAEVLGTHPVFGPGARDLKNQNFVLTPDNDREARLAAKVKSWLEARGSRVSVMTPGEHDERMAVVLGLAHYISIAAADTLADLDRLPGMKAVGGSTYRVLTTLVESVVSEDPELYATLQMHLPGLAEIEDLFQKKAAYWAELVKNRNKPEFKESMSSLKQRFAERHTDFGQAYENMYKIMALDNPFPRCS